VAFFISYSRRDDSAVRVLVEDLERTRHDTWLDRELGGGEEWWQEILDQIRRCEVFVLALSDHSMASRPCRAELDYAQALGVPVLPVQVGDIASLRTLPIAERQIVDFRERARTYTGRSPIVDTSIALVVSALELSAQRGELPVPLPAPPPIPFEYLMQLRLAVDAPDLDGRVQLQVLTQLKQGLREEDDPAARRDLVDLLRRLRRHPDATYRNVQEIDEILRGADMDDVVSSPVPATEETLPTPQARQGTTSVPLPSPAVDETDSGPAAGDAPTGSRTVVAAAAMGALGIGSLLSAVYSRSGEYTVYVGQWLVLALALVGFGRACIALRRREPHARTAVIVSAIGVVAGGAMAVGCQLSQSC
jgi:hypothetical protein